MPTKTVIASRSAVFAALALTTILVVQVAVVLLGCVPVHSKGI